MNGKEIELSLSNTLSNEEVVLAYHIQDAKTKQGINNLEPYLGAVGHVVILSEDAEQYIHVHPLTNGAQDLMRNSPLPSHTAVSTKSGDNFSIRVK